MPAKPSALLDTRVIYCGDNLDQVNKAAICRSRRMGVFGPCADSTLCVAPPRNQTESKPIRVNQTKSNQKIVRVPKQRERSRIQAVFEKLKQWRGQLARISPQSFPDKPKNKISRFQKNLFVLPAGMQHFDVTGKATGDVRQRVPINDSRRMTKLKGMTNISRVVILMLIFQTCGVALTYAQSPNVVGKWNVEITFANASRRSLQFDAQGAGKGSLLLVSPGPPQVNAAKPAEAKWSQSDQTSVTFSGPVEFPLGNVGRDAGKLMFKGKFESESLITGQVEFSPLVGDGPSKSGTFKATRAAGG